MDYTVLIERNSEDGYSEGADTLEDAVHVIEQYASGRSIWRAFINGKRVIMDGNKCRLESREAYEDESIMEAVDELGLRVQYGKFLRDRRNPNLSFETWKAKRPVPTNPATMTTIGEA